MGWAVGYDENWKRDVGYGVPAYCDHPKCNAEIDRGLTFVCGSEPYGGEHGCGLFFCEAHRAYGKHASNCPRCLAHKSPYKRPKPDHPRWIRWKLAHKSWRQWRIDNPSAVEAMRAALRSLVNR